MTPHQTLAVAVRLFAIWLTIYGARELLGFYIAAEEHGDRHSVMIVAAVILVTAAFLVLLWFFPRTIARGLLPLSGDTVAKPSPPEMWIAVGASVIGLWLVASALPALLRNGLVMYLFRAESLDRTGLTSGMIYYGIQLLVGLGLMLGVNGLRKLFLWARYA
jgi:hypothetical protein